MKQNIVYFLLKYVNFIKNLLIILFIWAIKEAVTRLAFTCPCLVDNGSDWWKSPDARQLYVAMYIVTPTVVFWIIGIFLQETTWRCVTGWRVQEKFVFPGRSCLCFFWTIGSTSLAPITWIFLLFLDGRYLECMEATTPAVCLPPDIDKPESTKLYMISQITAYSIAVGVFIVYFIVCLMTACCGSMTYYQWKHAHHIRHIEEESFYQASEEFHKQEMKKKWKTLFAAGSPTDWDTVSELPPNDPIKRKKRTHYTQFQNWNGVVAPDVITRNTDVIDSKMVTIIVKSSDANANVEINKYNQSNDHIWTSDKHSNPRGRDLPVPPPVIPPMTYSTMDTNGSAHPNHQLYPDLAENRDTDKYSLMRYDDPSFHSNVQTSTPKVKKKKSTKKKNKIEDTG